LGAAAGATGACANKFIPKLNTNKEVSKDFVVRMICILGLGLERKAPQWLGTQIHYSFRR
jgi:hypothetical protein